MVFSTIPRGAEFLPSTVRSSIWKSVLHCYTFLVVYIHLQNQQTPMIRLNLVDYHIFHATAIFFCRYIQPTIMVKVPPPPKKNSQKNITPINHRRKHLKVDTPGTPFPFVAPTKWGHPPLICCNSDLTSWQNQQICQYSQPR